MEQLIAELESQQIGITEVLLSPRTTLAGRSLASVLRGEGIDPRAVFAELLHPRENHTCVLEGDNHFIKVLPLEGGGEVKRYLFDWLRDPEEKVNLLSTEPAAGQFLEQALEANFSSLIDRKVDLNAETIEESFKKKLRALGYLK
jgi:hypothetical protein